MLSLSLSVLAMTVLFVFVDSKRRGEELKKLINQKLEENEEKANIAEYIDASTKDGDTYNQIINKSRFECKVLISTSVLDNGVNIKDKELKNIILLTLDKVGNIQSLGRKRLENKDAVNVYIPKFTETDLNKKLAQVKQNLIEYEKIKNDAAKYVFDYYKHRTTGNMAIIRMDGNDYKYNTFAYIKFKYEEKNLLKLLDKCKHGSDTCMKELLSWYGIERNEEFCKYTDNEYIIYKELKYYADNKFQTKDKQEFIDDFKVRCDDLMGKDPSDRNDRSKPYSIVRTNNRLVRLKMPFIFKETGDYIFVEYNQEDNVTNRDGGEKVQENNTVIRGKGENL